MQNSTFLLDVPQNIFENMLTRLKRTLKHDKDKIAYHPVCKRCLEDVLFWGTNPMADMTKPKHYVV